MITYYTPHALDAEAQEETQAILDKLMHGKPIDPAMAQRIRDRGDRLREEIFQQHGLLDIGVPAIRELRDR
jgi:hypothetical protein